MRTPHALLLAAILAGVTGCAAPQRTEALHATTVAVDTAHAAWMTYDAAHQTAIASGGPDEATVTKNLADWRAKAATVDKDFQAAYDAIIVAQNLNDDHSLAGVINAIQIAFADALSLGAKL